MISFGGVDTHNLTARTLRALSTLNDPLHLDIVLGLGYTKRDTIEPIIADYPPSFSIEINKNIQSMAEHMEQADLLITSGGRTLYEAGSLNLPTISISQNQSQQRHPYAHICRGILSLGLADYVSEEKIRAAVEKYIQNRQKRERMRSAPSEYDIANGVERVLDVILSDDG